MSTRTNDSRSERKEERRRFSAWTQLALLCAALLGAIALATQSRAAPQLILLTILAVIAINFSIPLLAQPFSPVLIVAALTTLLVAGYGPALAVLAAGFLLAELSRAQWQPLWQDTPLAGFGVADRLVRAGAHLISLAIAGWIYIQAGGNAPLTRAPLPRQREELGPLLLLWASHAILYLLFVALRAMLRDRRSLTMERAVSLLLISGSMAPFAFFGSLAFAALGLPALVIFSAGAGAVAIVTWLAWQRHFALERQIDQIATLNAFAVELRANLDLEAMLSRTCLVVQELVPNASVAVHLRPEGTKAALVGTNSAVLEAEADDETVGDGGDLVNWVIENGRLLSLQPGDLHFAARHGLSLPHPPPAAWLGIPLNPGGETVGALVLQRYEADLPFLQWQQELLVTLAGHVSAAIRNARLYSEVLRLYNLSDAALGQRLRQLQALLNSTEDGVLMLGKTGQILLVNPPAAELLGAPQATLQDVPIEAHEAADPLGFAPDELGALLESLAQGSPREGQRHVYAHYASGNQNKAGERRFLERSETPVVDADGNVIGWLLMLRDVTEEQERSEWRTNVTRMIVHDLRNPVTTLASTVDLIESAIAGDAVAAAQSYVAQARESCAEMLDMIDSLMDMTRLEAGQLNLDAEAMRIPSLAAQVIERLQPLARRRGIQLTLDVAAELPAVWADREMLRRVYVNLLDNALKFTPSQGRVTVQLSAEPAVDGHENGVRCTVVDTGPGIPAEERKRVFERFTRVNIGGGQVRGTGLGLTFCKLTIEAHGGTIWIEEADSGGARFVFTLPGIPRFEAPTV